MAGELFIGWLAGWLVGWLVGRSVGWSVGRLVGRSLLARSTRLMAIGLVFLSSSNTIKNAGKKLKSVISMFDFFTSNDNCTALAV